MPSQQQEQQQLVASFPSLMEGSVFGWSSANPHAGAEHRTTGPGIALMTREVCRDITVAPAK